MYIYIFIYTHLYAYTQKCIQVSAFGDLRDAVDAGSLAYPYSTRELVNLARHMEIFPSDGPATAVQNVLAFDQHNTLAMQTLRRIMHKHGTAACCSVLQCVAAYCSVLQCGVMRLLCRHCDASCTNTV